MGEGGDGIMIGLLRRTGVRSYRILRFFVSFCYDLVESNIVVTWEIITPRSGIAPAIIRLPVRCRTPAELTAFVAAVTLTPGTLVLEVDEDAESPAIYVHGMHALDLEGFRRSLRRLEYVLLAAMRPVADMPSSETADQPSSEGSP